MAHFFGSVKGQRGEASRLGSKRSDLQTTSASWQGSVDVRLYYDAETGRDMAHVTLQPWRGSGEHRELYHGPVSGCSKF